ncbi:MAG TPA: agmatinase [Candidatus Polarisedimenticolia bacterium]|nr:agmatinase [Candidatus Polarisedimenticolia bacterium]
MSAPEGPLSYGGLEPDQTRLDRARLVMIPVPYDRTASYQKGTADGPLAILEASTHMELWDDELGLEPCVIGIHTSPPVSGNEDPPEVMVRKVEEATARYLGMGKMPVVLGGEHSVSVGAIRAYERKYPRLSVVQLDAHGDLRDSFEGSIYNHACVMRRFAGRLPTLQIGIRSLSKEEADFIREKRLAVISAREFMRRPEGSLEAVDRLTDEIYLTIDVDYFDPAIMPGTGTPEPGGPGWHETLDFIRALCRRKRVVGFDVNELRPIEDDRSSEFLAAKLVYKIIAYRFFAEGHRAD